MKNNPELPPKLQALYGVLKGGKDVDFARIHQMIYGDFCDEPRKQQQYISVYITRLNRRLAKHGQKVQPGLIKGTYRLVSTR